MHEHGRHMVTAADERLREAPSSLHGCWARVASLLIVPGARVVRQVVGYNPGRWVTLQSGNIGNTRNLHSRTRSSEAWDALEGECGHG
jgi:hypothetical protein